jgi:hypothetical protein
LGKQTIKIMNIQKLKIDLMKKILAIDNAEVLEHILSIVDEEIEMNTIHFNTEDEIQKGIETILKMVQEFK